MKGFLLVVLVAVLTSGPAFGWDGYDYDKGSYIEIDRGTKVRNGETIEIYDYDSGSYKDVEVDSVNRSGSHVELEVTDSETGETRTFEMDQD